MHNTHVSRLLSSVPAAGLPPDLVGEVEWCGSLCKNTHVSRLLSSVLAAGLPADLVGEVEWCGSLCKNTHA